MRLFRTIACLAFTAALAGAASAEVPREDVRAFMEKSGMVKQLSGGEDDIRAGFWKQIEGQARPDLMQPLTEAFVAAWDSEKLLDAVETAYAAELTPDDLKAANEFLDTPLGRRAVAAETEAMSPQASKEIDENRAKLIAELEADERRMAAIQRIDTALRATDVSTTIWITLVRAGGIAAAGRADPDTLALADQFIQTIRPEMLKENRTIVLAMFAYTYREFSLDDLDAYADMMETDRARMMNGLFFAIADEHYQAVGEEFGRSMGTLLRQKRS